MANYFDQFDPVPQQAATPVPNYFDQFDPKPLPPEPSMGQQIGRQAGLTGRYAAEGLAGLADIPNMLLNYGVIKPGNALANFQGVPGGDVPQLPYPSQEVGNALTKMGVPQPEGGFERVIGDMSRALVGTGGMVGGATALGKSVPALAKLAQNPLMQARAALGSSGAAGTTREMGGGPLAQLGAGLVGGGLASMGGNPKTPAITSDDLRSKAGEAYKVAEQKGGVLTPEFTNKFLDEAEKATPQTVAGRLVGGDDPTTKIVERMRELRDRTLSLSEAQEIDEFLGDAIDAHTELGRVTKQGKKLLDVQSTLRNMIDSASGTEISGGKEGFDALKEGRKLWSKSAKLGDVERIIARADTAEVPATAIRSGFRTMLNNPNRVRGFSATEQKAITEAAQTGIIGETLRTMASRLVPIGSLVAGGGLGSTALAQVGSMAARSGATKYQLGKASKLADLIATGGLRQSSPSLNGLPRFLGTVQGMNQSKEKDKEK